jgi:deoxyinosine 3'endonuclease (endonuclease V)
MFHSLPKCSIKCCSGFFFLGKPTIGVAGQPVKLSKKIGNMVAEAVKASKRTENAVGQPVKASKRIKNMVAEAVKASKQIENAVRQPVKASKPIENSLSTQCQSVIKRRSCYENNGS